MSPEDGRVTGDDAPLKRLRTLRACEPCKLRKRRCDGRKPCSSCLRFEYQCSFSSGKQTRTKLRNERQPALHDVGSPPAHSPPKPPSKPDKESLSNERIREANAGVLFPSGVNLKLNSSDAPKLQGLGWNLGLRYKYSSSDRSMTWIISKREWQSLLDIYCKKIHRVYNFLHIDTVVKESSKRWEDPNATNCYDPILCGIAALACLFSQDYSDKQEHLLVQCAKEILEATSLVKDPTLHGTQAWLLRTLYLRFNSPPHAAWMASSITLQISEAVGLHQENTTCTQDTESCRRTFWIARLLNSWISFEYGRSRIMPPEITCPYPNLEGRDGTDILKLFQISSVLEPERYSDATELESALLDVEKLTFNLPALALSRCNLTFAIYRRLRMVSAVLKRDLLEKVVCIGRQGLTAASEAAALHEPWWHVSNVPFQFVYILLAMDYSEFLPYIETAISTLRAVASHFDTEMMRQALSTVEGTVHLFQKRKEQDMLTLQRAVGSPWQQPDLITRPYDASLQLFNPDQALPMWSDDLLWEAPSLNNVDWNQFWVNPVEPITNTDLT